MFFFFFNSAGTLISLHRIFILTGAVNFKHNFEIQHVEGHFYVDLISLKLFLLTIGVYKIVFWSSTTGIINVSVSSVAEELFLT